MKELMKQLVSIADQLDDKGYDRYADLIEAIIKGLLEKDGRKMVEEEEHEPKSQHHGEVDKDEPDKVKEDKEQIKDDAVEIRKKIVDDEGIEDLFDAKEKITELKNSGDYDLTDDEWEKIYAQILEDKFKRDYTEKDKEELEKELNQLLEDKKRKGSLTREEEMEYEMINNIYKRKINEVVRPSDKS